MTPRLAEGFDAGDSNLYRYVNNAPGLRTDPAGFVSVFFHGFAGFSYPNHSENKNVYPLYRWADKHFSQAPAHLEVAQAVAFIVKRVGGPARPKEPIVLVGHSLGGLSAYQTATVLTSMGYCIDLLATLDPVAMTTFPLQLFFGGLWPVPLLVRRTWNWHQTVVNPEGAIMVGFPRQSIVNTKDAKGPDGQVLKHTLIDDDQAIANEIRNESVRLHNR
jgi:pimeloyl-ACP methyl ester carboxylesterase